jgi:hypothetical protein
MTFVKEWVIDGNEIKQGKGGSICAVNMNVDDWEQNIKLIAAAPYLLEACEQMKEALYNLDCRDVITEKILEAENKIFDAVNKATKYIKKV